jgi:hypothetical protein
MATRKHKNGAPKTWDVFLSHNRAQKPLVRAIAQQWRKLGLAVFFDEDSILPGERIADALGKGLMNSRHVVCMLTPASMASKWVSLETETTIALDPGADQRRLIPVILESVDHSALNPIILGLRMVDLTDPTSQRRQYHHLLDSVGVTTKPLPDLPRPEAEGAGTATPTRGKPVLESGTMSTDSPYYVEREADRSIRDLFYGPKTSFVLNNKTVTIKGHKQSGKSSLLVRIEAWAVEQGCTTCYIDFQGKDDEELKTTGDLFRSIANSISDELHIDFDPELEWKADGRWKEKLTSFVEAKVLALGEQEVVFLFDEADLTFPYGEVCKVLFSTLRFWHNKRPRDHKDRGWKRLWLIVAHSTEPSLWIRDLNQSPFNVGQSVVLEDFDERKVVPREVPELNERYQSPLRTDEEIRGLLELVGGHPFLARLALDRLVAQSCSFAELESTAINPESPFVTLHLKHLWELIQADKSLVSALREILRYGKCDDGKSFERLDAAGLSRVDASGRVSLRYKIYNDYFRQKLL